jgi:hypothetical protein
MSEMTVTQAIKRMSKLKGQLSDLRERAKENLVHLAEDTPAYTFAECLAEASKVRDELLKLKTAVAMSNAKLTIEWEGAKHPLPWAIALLREWKGELEFLKSLPVRAQAETTERNKEFDGDKYVPVVTKHKCHLPTKERDMLRSVLQDRYDDLNDRVNALNGRTNIAVD